MLSQGSPYGQALRELFLCICTIADRLSAAPQKFSSMVLDRNGCLHYNEFIFELNIYITHISFSRYIADCGDIPWAVFCICFFLSHT